MYHKQLDSDADSLNPEALHEISRLQENILQTLRNELKKLKEPEVMGASNVSTPTYEIGQDMTPLPSVKGSSANLLKPRRIFSPMSPRRGKINSKKLRAVPTKKTLISSESSRHPSKYNYKTRNYPRPWADPPHKRRTISEESLEVHVTSSHFSDISNLELSMKLESENGDELKAGGGGNEEMIDHLEEQLHAVQWPRMSQIKSNDEPKESLLNRVDSSELWKNSLTFKDKPSVTLKGGENSKINLQNSRPTKGSRLLSQIPSVRQCTDVNFFFTSTNPRMAVRKHQRAVVFPAPVPESKKLNPPPLSQLSQKVDLTLDLFEVTDRKNNNFLAELLPPKGKSRFKAIRESCFPTGGETIAGGMNKSSTHPSPKPIMQSQSIQVTSQRDVIVQTDDNPSSVSSEFELGLFVATLLDELLDAACERRSYKSKHHSHPPYHYYHLPPHPTPRINEADPSELSRDQMSGRVTRSGRRGGIIGLVRGSGGEGCRNKSWKYGGYVRECGNKNNEEMSLSQTKKADLIMKLKEGGKEDPAESKAHHHHRGEEDPKIDPKEPVPGGVDGTSPASSHTKASKCVATNFIDTRDAQSSPHQKIVKLKSLEKDEEGKEEEQRQFKSPFKHSYLKTADLDRALGFSSLNQSVTDTSLEVIDTARLSHFDMNMMKLRPEEVKFHRAKQTHYLLNSLKAAGRPKAKIMKKLWCVLESDDDPIDHIDCDPDSSVSSIQMRWLQKNSLRDTGGGTKINSRLEGPDISHRLNNNQMQQTYSRVTSHRHPQLKAARKRNIKMSYHPPEFADLFPRAGTILAEASNFLPKLEVKALRVHSKCTKGMRPWANQNHNNNRFLTPLWFRHLNNKCSAD